MLVWYGKPYTVDPHVRETWKKKSSHVSSHASPPYARVVHTDAAMVVPVSWLTRGGEARWWLGLGVEGKGGRQEKVGEDTTSSFPCMSRRRVPPHARTHATSELLPAYVPQPVTPPSARTVASDSSPRARRGWLLARVTDRDPSPCAPWRQDPPACCCEAREEEEERERECADGVRRNAPTERYQFSCLAFCHPWIACMPSAGMWVEGNWWPCFDEVAGHSGQWSVTTLDFRLGPILMSGGRTVERNNLHCSCVVGVLRRSAAVYGAWELLQQMPFEPTASIWGSLLGSYSI